MVFFDLAPQLASLRREGTAFVPHAVRILNSRSGYDDSILIESLVFSNRSCPVSSDQFADSFTELDTSRSEVNFDVKETLPNCALPRPGAGLQFLNLNEECATSVVANEVVSGLEFEPACLVAVVQPASRKALFDEMMATGRPLDEYLQVEVNYTVALEPDPIVASASANCQNSMILIENYARDRTLQLEFTELEEVRAARDTTQELRNFLEYALDNRRLFQSPSPPPPPPPPPVPALAPPASPIQVTPTQRLAELQYQIDIYTARERALLAVIDECVNSVGTRELVCGLSTAAASDPWLSNTSEPCRGYATRSTRVGDYCGFWESEYNPDAASADEQAELLETGPTCFADEEGTRVLACPSTADRTQRSGIYELEVRACKSP